MENFNLAEPEEKRDGITVAGVFFPFNNQQQAAVNDIEAWFKKIKKLKKEGLTVGDLAVLVYILQGYAGTGKTSLVKSLFEKLGIPLARIALVAPTNRAAKVLANKTGLFTRTLFSLLYASQREELELVRVRLRSWDEASSFVQLGDLLVESQDPEWEEEFQRQWESNYHDSEIESQQLEQERLRAKESFLASRITQILVYENIQLPDEAEPRNKLFQVMKKERMQQHREEIKEILAQDMPTRLKDPSEISSRYDIIICDEASMVNLAQGNDLMKIGIPVLLVGDPFQLPPVRAKAYWDGKRANTVLTRIERQKGAGAGIPLAGERIRNSKSIERNESVQLFNRNTLPDEDWLAADQILVGTHRTREKLCNYIRKLKNLSTPYPVAGEKVVAVYNDKGIGIMNGELYEVVSSEQARNGTVTLMTLKDPYGLIIENVSAWTSGFGGRSKTEFLDEAYGKFWFGYAITCHQSQGSEWQEVIVCDDWPRNDIDVWRRWLYTAVTRAATKVKVIA